MAFIPLFLDTVGSVLIGWAALRVHHRVMNEHTIDRRVLRTMRFEQQFGILGLVFVVLSFLLQLLELPFLF